MTRKLDSFAKSSSNGFSTTDDSGKRLTCQIIGVISSSVVVTKPWNGKELGKKSLAIFSSLVCMHNWLTGVTFFSFAFLETLFFATCLMPSSFPNSFSNIRCRCIPRYVHQHVSNLIKGRKLFFCSCRQSLGRKLFLKISSFFSVHFLA